MILKAIAWDIDGTLADSEPLHEDVTETVCRRWGADISDLPKDYFRGVHMGDVWLALKDRFPPDLKEEVWRDAIIDAYIAGSGSLRPIHGAVDTVKAFAARGIRQACVSNSGRRIVDANLRALGIASYLEFSISLDDVGKGKPDPEPYATACRKFDLLPVEVLAVEDSVAGYSSARTAGLMTAFYAPLADGIPSADHNLADLAMIVDIVDDVNAPATSAL
jgi:beta-phosphoglucomutase-like phosphatase (HAD superfamily)